MPVQLADDQPVSGPLIARNPATGAVLAEFDQPSAGQIGELVARSAAVRPLWALLRLEDRARYVRNVGQAIIDEFDDLLEGLAREQGRPMAEIATLELLPAIDSLIWIADHGPEVLGDKHIGMHRSMSLTKRAWAVREPLGVMAVMSAGCTPFAIPITQLACALLAGNGVIFKPARRAALAGERIAQLLARAGLPDGLVAVVNGGDEAGQAIARGPVSRVLIYGSPAVAGAVAQTGPHDRVLMLEVKGKDAMLIAPDANLTGAADCAVWSAFAAAGQAPGSVERIFVAQELCEQFVELLSHKTRGLTVGDPMDPSIQVGPLADGNALNHVAELVNEAVADGARALCGAEQLHPDGLSGSFYAPTVLADVTAEMRILREPINGPVVTVTAVRSMDEAIALANRCEHRVASSVFSADRHQARWMAHALDYGTVWMNDHPPAPIVSGGPWGVQIVGGQAPTQGTAGLLACTREKLISWDPPGARGLWRGPYGPTLRAAAKTVAELRSARDMHREHAWRHGIRSLASLGVRALPPRER